jgi:hypothetical protein
MKVGSHDVGWTEALLLAKDYNINKIKSEDNEGIGGFFRRTGARLCAFGSVIHQTTAGRFGFENETLKKAMSDPSNIGAGVQVIENRLVEGVNNLKDRAEGFMDKIERGARKFMGNETIGDRVPEEVDEIKQKAQKLGNSFLAGLENVKKFFA